MATVATFFESCVSREILGGDRPGPWLEVFAQVVSAWAAGVGGRAGGETGVAGAAAGRRPPAGCSHGARGHEWGAGELRNIPGPAPPPPLSKPPEAPPAPVPQFPLSKCGHPLACLSRGNGSICQALWNLKRRAPPREWLLLMHGGAGERGFARSGALSLGKEVTLRRRRTAVTHVVEGGRVGGDTAEGAFLPSPHPESALRRWGRHRAPLAHFGVRQVPWHLPGDLRLAADQDSCPSHLAWVG